MASLAKHVSAASCRFIRCSNPSVLKRTTLTRVMLKDFCQMTAKPTVLTRVASINVTSACGLHTEKVDKEFSQFLEAEIASEKSNQSGSLPKFRGWNVKTNGTSVTLNKMADQESLTLSLNVNFSTDSSDEVDFNADPDTQDDQLVSKPIFQIEVKKQSGLKMSMECMFSREDDTSEELADDKQDTPEELAGDKKDGKHDAADRFEIVSVSIHDGDLNDNTYQAHVDNMDMTLYDNLMNFLDERGIDTEFIDQLSTFCTKYEQEQYLSFLNNMKKFVDEV